MRLLRIDDYPHGNRETFKTKTRKEWRNLFSDVIQPFENLKVPYLIGVSPLLLLDEDIDFLNYKIHSGSIVMHGFTHWFDTDVPWKKIREYWGLGGEFHLKSNQQILDLWQKSNQILRHIQNYDSKFFIPPFNTITQEGLDALNETDVKILLGLDLINNQFQYQTLNLGKLQWALSEWEVTYAPVNQVLMKLAYSEAPITLHWIFDTDQSNWQLAYEQFAMAFKRKHGNAS